MPGNGPLLYQKAEAGVRFICILMQTHAQALSLAYNWRQQNALDHRFFTKSCVKPAKLGEIVVRTLKERLCQPNGKI
jgi:hypothetical protein